MTKILGILRIIGLISVISYMTAILFIWISANFMGFVYFSAGEPVSLIKYPEWILGFIGLVVSIDYLRMELIRKKYKEVIECSIENTGNTKMVNGKIK